MSKKKNELRDADWLELCLATSIVLRQRRCDSIRLAVGSVLNYKALGTKTSCHKGIE